jgi:hypothetical protein
MQSMPCYWCICHNNTLEFDFQQLQQISIKKSFFFLAKPVAILFFLGELGGPG